MTRHEFAGPGTTSCFGEEFLHEDRTNPEGQPRLQTRVYRVYRNLFPRRKDGRYVTLTTDLNLLPKYKKKEFCHNKPLHSHYDEPVYREKFASFRLDYYWLFS
jgi:hypothetical protein